MGVLDGIKAILSPAGDWAWAELGKKTRTILTLPVIKMIFLIKTRPILARSYEARVRGSRIGKLDMFGLQILLFHFRAALSITPRGYSKYINHNPW